MKIHIQANPNYHTVGKPTVFDSRLNDERFQEYRRQWIENPAAFKVADFPIHLDIESTGLCNLRCPFCATTTDHWGKKAGGFMDFGLYKRIIDEGSARGLCSIKLSFRGEPLLHKNIADMVAYARDHGVLDIYFNTNATLLNEAMIHRLIDAGLPRLSVSFEGITAAVYESHRVGASFDKVVANVKAFRRIRDERKSLFPQLRVQMVMLPELKDDFTKYVEFWKPIADEVGTLDARFEGPQYDHRGRTGAWACPFLWQRMVVLWDGCILPCLMHGLEDFSTMILGNAKDMSIGAAWLGEKERLFRQQHQKGEAHQLTACDACSYRAMELDKLGVPPKGEKK